MAQSADHSSDINTSLSGFRPEELPSGLCGEDASACSSGLPCRNSALRSGVWEPDNSVVKHFRLLASHRELARMSPQKVADCAAEILASPSWGVCSIEAGLLVIRDSSTAVRRFELLWSRVKQRRDRGLAARLPDVSFIDLVVGSSSWLFFCPCNFTNEILWCLCSHGCIRTDLTSAIPSANAEQDKIAAGASANVFTATLKRPGSSAGDWVVAVKTIKTVGCDNGEKVVQREACMIAAAGLHPNIIRHHGIFHSPTQPITWSFVMDFHALGDLWEYASGKSGLGVTEARPILRDLLSALGHLHKRNILHRDVKPENVLIDEDLSATLCDFGLSCFVSDQDAMRNNGFTNAYASQELRWGAPGTVIGTSSDIFGAGATLHYMFTLRYVFGVAKEKQNEEMYRAGVLCFTDGPLRFLPQVWQDLLQRMVCLAPGRLTAAQALQHHALSNAWDCSKHQRRAKGAAGQQAKEPAAQAQQVVEQSQPQLQPQRCFEAVVPRPQPEPQQQPQADAGSIAAAPTASLPEKKKKKHRQFFSRLWKMLPKSPFVRGAAKVQPSPYTVDDDIDDAQDLPSN